MPANVCVYCMQYRDLIKHIRTAGRKLVAAQPSGEWCKHVLYCICMYNLSNIQKVQ